MKTSKDWLNTNVDGELAPRHVNLLIQKTTPDDDDDDNFVPKLSNKTAVKSHCC